MGHVIHELIKLDCMFCTLLQSQIFKISCLTYLASALRFREKFQDLKISVNSTHLLCPTNPSNRQKFENILYY